MCRKVNLLEGVTLVDPQEVCLYNNALCHMGKKIMYFYINSLISFLRCQCFHDK